LARRLVDLEEANALPTETGGPRVEACSEDHDLADPAIECPGDTVVEVPSAKRHPELHRGRMLIPTSRERLPFRAR